MANYASFHTAQDPKLEVLINAELVRAVFSDEKTHSCTLVFDEKYAVVVSGGLKDVESKLRGTASAFKR